MDYSKTVNLPETDFPMKANLPEKEPAILKKWETEKIYETLLQSRENQPLYILHDGPPYANGHIHIGHALNKILKDIIVKHKTMMGHKSPYIPGWDCHGLPIELNVTKELGPKAKTMSKADIRKKCREYAEKFVNIQMSEFKRLGVFGDFDNPYKTMSTGYEAKIVEIFGQLYEQGYIFRNKKPIYWCPTCVTALAEAEVEYENHKSTSVYVKFKIDPKSINVTGIDSDNLFALIWTTTPWTLPANLALSFHPDFEYSAVKFGNEFYIIAKELVSRLEELLGTAKSAEISLQKNQIEQLKAYHPFIERESKIVFGTHVTLEQGTGIVHTAPGHGNEDYIVGLHYGLEAYCPVNDEGRFTDDFPEMKGVNVFDANPKIVELLKEKNMLVHSGIIEHSYPHCWRCKKQLIFRATEQWFLGMDRNNLRQNGLKAVDETEWIPSWGETRFRSMVESRPDWCLSRQRSWGVPIPSFKCSKCGENNMTPASVKHFSDLSKSKSIDIWYTDDIKDLIPAGTKCKCGSSDFTKEFDILDVWFDSGVSHYAVLDVWPGLRWPADIYLEGSDQHRGWFQSSLWPALALRQKAPFKTVLTHGFVLDEHGKAMSKSVGNVIPPETIIKQFGADILRLWVSSEDYRNDLRIGMDMINQIADSYRKIRNTFKFIIGNLSDFTEADSLSYEKLSDLDKWMLHKLYLLTEKIIEHYEKFEFHLVYRKLVNFCAVELSSIYFDISKDILYVELKNSDKRRANQTVLNEIYKSLLRLCAPILAFTTEEIWMFKNLPGTVHTEKYYMPDKKYFNTDVESRMENLVNVKKDALKAMEILRKDKTIKASLEADIYVYSEDKNTKALFDAFGDEARRFFQVAKLVISDVKDPRMIKYDYSWIFIEKSRGKKCTRCWNYTEVTGSDSDHPDLCPRCTEIVKKITI